MLIEILMKQTKGKEDIYDKLTIISDVTLNNIDNQCYPGVPGKKCPRFK